MSILPFIQQNRWNVTDENGATIVTFTSFISIDYRSESKVLENPTEDGSFFSYNKVSTPYEITVTLAIQGNSTELQSTLNKLLSLVDSTTLINVETPSKIITSSTLSGVNYMFQREDGINLLVVDLKLKEVKRVKQQYTNVKVPPIANNQAKNPSDVSTQDGGKQQTTDPPPTSTLTKIVNGLF